MHQILALAVFFRLRFNSDLRNPPPGLQDGLGLHRSEITWLAPDEATLRSKRDQWFTEQFYALTLGTSKLAVLGLYWRLFSAFDSARYAIIFLAIAVLLWVCIRV